MANSGGCDVKMARNESCGLFFSCCNESCTDEHNMTVGRLLTYRHIYAKIYGLNVVTPSNLL